MSSSFCGTILNNVELDPVFSDDDGCDLSTLDIWCLVYLADQFLECSNVGTTFYHFGVVDVLRHIDSAIAGAIFSGP